MPARTNNNPITCDAAAQECGVVYVSRPGETPDPGQPPAQVELPTLTPGTPGEVQADWVGVEAATSYPVERQEVGVDADFIEETTTPDVIVTITGLTTGNTLRVRVIAINENGESPASDVAEVVVG